MRTAVLRAGEAAMGGAFEAVGKGDAAREAALVGSATV